MSDFGLRIGLEGERDFKAALRDINQAFKVLGSEMALVTSQFEKNDRSAQSLTSRNAVLTKEIDQQRDKVTTLRSALDNAAASFGDTTSHSIDQVKKLVSDGKIGMEEFQAAMRAEAFGIKPGQTVVDYGCGPGRYTVELARLVGTEGKVIAVDLVELALQETQRKLEAGGFQNFELKLAHGYDSSITDEIADIVFAIDMFHHIADTNTFLQEVSRISKPDGLLILSGGHMTRAAVKNKIAMSGIWDIAKERKEFIEYKKRVTH